MALPYSYNAADQAGEETGENAQEPQQVTPPTPPAIIGQSPSAGSNEAAPLLPKTETANNAGGASVDVRVDSAPRDGSGHSPSATLQVNGGAERRLPKKADGIPGNNNSVGEVLQWLFVELPTKLWFVVYLLLALAHLTLVFLSN